MSESFVTANDIKSYICLFQEYQNMTCQKRETLLDARYLHDTYALQEAHTSDKDNQDICLNALGKSENMFSTYKQKVKGIDKKFLMFRPFKYDSKLGAQTERYKSLFNDSQITIDVKHIDALKFDLVGRVLDTLYHENIKTTQEDITALKYAVLGSASIEGSILAIWLWYFIKQYENCQLILQEYEAERPSNCPIFTGCLSLNQKTKNEALVMLFATFIATVYEQFRSLHSSVAIATNILYNGTYLFPLIAVTTPEQFSEIKNLFGRLVLSCKETALSFECFQTLPQNRIQKELPKYLRLASIQSDNAYLQKDVHSDDKSDWFKYSQCPQDRPITLHNVFYDKDEVDCSYLSDMTEASWKCFNVQTSFKYTFKIHYKEEELKHTETYIEEHIKKIYAFTSADSYDVQKLLHEDENEKVRSFLQMFRGSTKYRISDVAFKEKSFKVTLLERKQWERAGGIQERDTTSVTVLHKYIKFCQDKTLKLFNNAIFIRVLFGTPLKDRLVCPFKIEKGYIKQVSYADVSKLISQKKDFEAFIKYNDNFDKRQRPKKLQEGYMYSLFSIPYKEEYNTLQQAMSFAKSRIFSVCPFFMTSIILYKQSKETVERIGNLIWSASGEEFRNTDLSKQGVKEVYYRPYRNPYEMVRDKNFLNLIHYDAYMAQLKDALHNKIKDPFTAGVICAHYCDVSDQQLLDITDAAEAYDTYGMQWKKNVPQNILDTYYFFVSLAREKIINDFRLIKEQILVEEYNKQYLPAKAKLDALIERLITNLHRELKPDSYIKLVEDSITDEFDTVSINGFTLTTGDYLEKMQASHSDQLLRSASYDEIKHQLINDQVVIRVNSLIQQGAYDKEFFDEAKKILEKQEQLRKEQERQLLHKQMDEQDTWNFIVASVNSGMLEINELTQLQQNIVQEINRRGEVELLKKTLKESFKKENKKQEVIITFDL